MRELVAALERHAPPPFRVYVVHGGDRHPAVMAAHALAADRPWLRPIENDDEAGIAGALRRGFRIVGTGPTLVTTLDAGDDLSMLPRMLGLYARGFRIVCPSRFARGGRQIGGSRPKRALLRAAGALLGVVVRFPTRDLNNNYRLYDAALVNEMGIESVTGVDVAFELTAKAFRRGVPIAEVPITWTDRRGSGPSGDGGQWLGGYLRWYLHALRSGRRPP
jgi:hypothetical protein